MSQDYPDRKVWLAKRCTPRGQLHGFLARPMGMGGGNKDPGYFHHHRRWKGKKMATGQNSYYESDRRTARALYLFALATGDISNE